jgi:Tfp pilus assembly protein PilE
MPVLLAIGGFIPGLFGKEVSERVAKVIAVALLVVGLLALIALGKFAYDRSVINRYRLEQVAAQQQKDREATERADKAEKDRTARREQQNQSLEAAATEAAEKEPEKARATVGPVTQSYYDTLRKEKK